MTPHYHINIRWADRDDRSISDVSDLRGCIARGDTAAGTVDEAEVAVDLWLASAREHGDPVPAPCYRPAIHVAHAA